MEIGSVVRKDSFHPLDLLDHRGDDMSSPADSATEIDLAIGGMTCASCAMHVERSLNKVPGVTATVNFATQKAHVVLPAQVSVADAITAVEATGYTATVPAARSASPSADESPEGAVAVHALRTRLTVCMSESTKTRGCASMGKRCRRSIAAA